MRKKRKAKWIEQLQSPEDELNTEQIRIIRTNIQHAVNHEKLVLMITSPEVNELQPFIAAKLAHSFAETGKKVLLADVNFRKPSLHELFDIDNVAGLSNMLRDEEGRFSETSNQNLFVLPIGSLPTHPEGLEKVEQLMREWQHYYDVIVLEAPAFLEVADAQILSTACNGVVLVLQESKTKTEDVLQVKKALERTGNSILGAIYQTS